MTWQEKAIELLKDYLAVKARVRPEELYKTLGVRLAISLLQDSLIEDLEASIKELKK